MSSKWSLCIIARDNEDKIGRTLESAKPLFDEIIVVDTGSLDKTKEVAESYGAITYDFEWIDDFAAARNYSFSKATGDWIMWLDTGDIIPPASVKAFQQLKLHLTTQKESDIPEGFVVRMNRNIETDGTIVSWHLTVRLVRKSANPYWKDAIHESLHTDNDNMLIFREAWVDDLNALYQEKSKRNLRILEKLRDEGRNDAWLWYYFGQEHFVHEEYEEAIEAGKNLIALGDATNFRYEALINIHKCYVALKTPEKGIDYLLQAISFYPARPEAFIYLGDFYYNLQQWDFARPFYQAVIGSATTTNHGINVDPRFYDGHYPYGRLGMCHAEMGRHKEALDALRKGLDRAPEKHKDVYRGVIKDIQRYRKEHAKK